MSRTVRRRAISIHSLIFLALLAATPSVVFAQSSSVGIPENASAKSYGSGWQCDRGYREADGVCGAIEVPAHAYAFDTSYGRGWECGRGYQEHNETCTAVAVPQNAYLNASGDSWECNRSYLQVGEACAAIEVPANGYLTDTAHGSGWSAIVAIGRSARLARLSTSQRTDISWTRRTDLDGNAIADIER